MHWAALPCTALPCSAHSARIVPRGYPRAHPKPALSQTQSNRRSSGPCPPRRQLPRLRFDPSRRVITAARGHRKRVSNSNWWGCARAGQGGAAGRPYLDSTRGTRLLPGGGGGAGAELCNAGREMRPQCR